jgi:hypothetical protein
MTKWSDLLKEAGAAGAGFEPLPIGTYDVKITKSTHKVAQSGKSMFEVEMQVLSGPHANRRIWNRFVISPENPKALAYFFGNMRALGLTTTFFEGSPTDEQVAAALTDKQCRIEVGQSEYNGSVRNDVKKVLPPEGGQTATTTAPSAAGVPNVAAPVVDTTPAAAPTPAVTEAPTTSTSFPSVPF